MEKTERDFDAGVAATEPLRFMYKNYRGEHAERRVLPRGFRFGTSEFHPKPQWLLLAYDLDKKALREFSFEEIRCPETSGWWSRAFDDVATERRRQVEVEGWTPEHDDAHANGELAGAAACYAIGATVSKLKWGHKSPPAIWPWRKSWWKIEGGARRMLVKAGALIIAEIERLDRADAAKG
ncbi:MAG: hypothetical protein EOS70_27755 [Mesorhizobium sp.]|uniref:hypothetical protein n=1 Tax=Mesorhizobium sp. TaxID=1871066 RepID=UPI000FE77EDC|nr:hypothetical protein [Mesorhizobium sp.]RWC28111.1 MAG: hypothetical protein EOS70_27755 [Mesorhizobium sp.]